MREINFLWILGFFLNSLAAKRGFISSRDAGLLQLALLLTVAADFNLILTGNIEAGIVAFCAVQAVYCIRYGGAAAFLRLCGAWCVLLAVLHGFGIDRIISLAALYAVALAASLTAAARARKKYPYPNNLLVVWGMALFAFCDVNVALNFVGVRPNATFNLIWFFYLPAQYLLSISAKRFAL